MKHALLGEESEVLHEAGVSTRLSEQTLARTRSTAAGSLSSETL